MKNLAGESHFLGIGDMVFGQAPASIVTVLGSCVAITMYDPKQQLGAICHAALPKCLDQQCHSSYCKPGKHVACAVRVMLRQFARHSICRQDIQVKIFGGADMFAKQVNKPPLFAIGSMNDEAALRVLQQEGLTIEAMDTGGVSRRKVTFDMSTGRVMVEKARGLRPRNSIRENVTPPSSLYMPTHEH
ncbi:MAG: chemotaxis protein CheD [Thermodesulfobacteriota bacterium]